MAEIIAEPTALSKVIALKFKINDVDVPKTTQLSTNKQFNTTDTDAWFTFELDGLASTGGTYDLTLINLDDKSIFHHDHVLFPTLPFHYKLNSSEDVTLNEIRHAGRWLGQLVVTLSNGDTTARQFGFNIAGHILDGQDAQVILLSDYQALINTINLAKDDLAQYNVDYAALLVDIAAAEDARVTAYNQLLADQQANIEAFDVALDEGIVAANLATKLQDFETTNNSRLLSAEQQLADTQADLQAGIGALTVDSEVVTARSSTVTGVVHTVLDNRLEAIESDTVLNATSLVTNGDFSTGSAPWVFEGTSEAALYTLDSKVGTNSIRMNTTNSSSIVAFDVEVPVGNILYAGVWGKLLSITDGPYADSILTVHENAYTNVVEGKLDIGLLNIWQHVSLIKKATTSSIKVLGGHVGYTIRDLLIDGFTVIDLTATFGKGNEPTVEQMDEIMSKFPNSWFDGTKNLFRASETLKKQIALDARTEFEAKNLVANGDFSNGTNGWTPVQDANLISDYTYPLTTVKLVTSSAYKGFHQQLSVNAGDKIYISFIACGSSTVQISTKNAGIDEIGITENPARYSSIYQWLSYFDSYIGLYNVSAGTNYYGYFKVINLTATFGAGNEPTVEQMDRLLTQFPNSWFDGTTNLFLAKWALDELRRLDNEKANKVQEAWITPTLVNGATGTFQYRKNEFGRLEFKGELTQASTASYFAITIAGYRPPTWIRCPITSIDGVVSMLIISDGGALHLHTPLAGKTISFNGVSINIQ